MSLKDEFQKACTAIQESDDFENKPDEEKLAIYALFKQAVVGDVNIPEPGMFKPKEKAKWNAWKSKAGMTKEKAMEEYIALAKKYVSF
jgi:diazepam-binding inhibitor (GABA receptor modulating acyl-CoA-binding protein)